MLSSVDRPGDVTRILDKLSGLGTDAPKADRESLQDQLYHLVYSDLRRRAVGQLYGERGGYALQPSDLVNEAYLELVEYRMRFESRKHFLNVASQAMRRILIDRARARVSLKRGAGVHHEPLEGVTAVQASELQPETLISLDQALAVLDADQTRLVELRYFLGLSFEETAEALDSKPSTLKKRWRVIRVLLYDRLTRRPAAS